MDRSKACWKANGDHEKSNFSAILNVIGFASHRATGRGWRIEEGKGGCVGVSIGVEEGRGSRLRVRMSMFTDHCHFLVFFH